MDLDIVRKWWNIFRSILEGVGSEVFLKSESQGALIQTLDEILSCLNYARNIIQMILDFINIAYRFLVFIKDWASGARGRPLEY